SQQFGRSAQIHQTDPGHQLGTGQRAPSDRLALASRQRERQRAVRRYRTALEEHRRAGYQVCPRLEHLPDRNLAWPVEHDPESSFFCVVLNDQDYGAPEVNITKHRGGREQLTRAGFLLHASMMLHLAARLPGGRAQLRTAGWKAWTWP